MKSRIERFATKHRLKTRIDREDGTMIIPGKNGRSHIYELADGVLAFVLRHAKKSSQWSFLLAKLVAPAFRIVQTAILKGRASLTIRTRKRSAWCGGFAGFMPGEICLLRR